MKTASAVGLVLLLLPFLADGQSLGDAARKEAERRQKNRDESGRTVIRDLQHLRQTLARAKAEWDAAEQAIRDLAEEARRAGVPPGWLR